MKIGFFSWKGNVLTFQESKIVFYLVFALFALATLFIWIFKENISKFFEKRKKQGIITRVLGIILLSVLLSRTILLATQDWPWQWEYIPIHLCRLLLYLIAIFLIINRVHLIKYFSIFAFIGATLAILFANISRAKEFADEDIAYNGLKAGTEAFKNAGFEWGYDNWFFWEFLIMHSIMLPIVVLMHIYSPKKGIINLVILYRGMFILLSLAIFSYFFSWALHEILKNWGNQKAQIAWNINWLYMGQVGIGTLGKITRWPFNIISLPIVILILGHIGYLFYILFSLVQIDFTNRKTIKYLTYNKDLEYLESKNDSWLKFRCFKKTFRDNQWPMKTFFNFKEYN